MKQNEVSIRSYLHCSPSRHGTYPFRCQSAYGKLLARLSESTIDRVWHIGIEQVTPHGVAGCGPNCGHDHAPGETCEHGESADTFTFHVDDSGNIEEESSHNELDHAGHDHGDHSEHAIKEQDPSQQHSETCNHDHAPGESCNHDHAQNASVNGNKFALLGDTPKEWLQNASIVRYKRTNPKSLSPRHSAAIKKDVEQMLLRSYKMDPTHYGAYNSYHLFLTAHDFGGTDATKRHARTIAEHTLQVISHEKQDPEAWLTAAAAASNLFFLESGEASLKGEKLSTESLKNHRHRIGFCLGQFAALQEISLNNGTWNSVPTKRQLEIETRSRFALKTFEQFDAMIARAESRSSSKREGTMVGGIEIP